MAGKILEIRPLAEPILKQSMQKVFFSVLLLSLISCAQRSKDTISAVIDNSRTNKHVNIPGTRLYIFPPADFSVAKTFVGLQKGETSSVNIFDLVGGNFNTNAAKFSRDGFEREGIKVFDYQEISVSGFSAKFVSMQGDMASRTYGLVFGDTTFSTMIMAVYPASDEATGADIVESLNTIWYDKEKKIDPFETANFTLDENASKFKFFQFNAGFHVYKIDGVEHKEDKDEPMLMVMQFPRDQASNLESIAETMIGKMGQYGLSNPRIEISPIQKLNGYDAYEAVVYGEIEGNKSLIYYCIVARDDIAIVLQGIAKKDMDTNLQEFKKLANTIKLK
jgi:hypothetical protein